MATRTHHDPIAQASSVAISGMSIPSLAAEAMESARALVALARLLGRQAARSQPSGHGRILKTRTVK